MIFNRPANLWLGAATAIFNVVVLILGTISPQVVAGVNVALAAVITLIAFQPPTVNTDSTVKVNTSDGGPNKVVTFTSAGDAITKDAV